MPRKSRWKCISMLPNCVCMHLRCLCLYMCTYVHLFCGCIEMLSSLSKPYSIYQLFSKRQTAKYDCITVVTLGRLLFCSVGVIMCFFGTRNSWNAFGLRGEGCSKKLFPRNMFQKTRIEE